MAKIDPFSGSEIYSANSMGAQMGIDTAQGMGIDVPLAFRMAEHLPGISTSVGFTTARGTNTIMRGGFLEGGGFISDRTSRLFSNRRSKKYRMFDRRSGFLNAKQPTQFVMGKSRATKVMANREKAGLLKSMRLNNATIRPRAFGRFHSNSIFGPEGYTPFGASRMLGKSARVSSFFEKRGITASEGESLLGPGFLSFVGAGRRSDLLEKRALRQLNRSGEISGRTLKKIGRLNTSITDLARMNNPSLAASRVSYSGSTVAYKDALGMTSRARGGLTASEFVEKSRPIVTGQASIVEETLGKAISAETVGMRGNLLASSMYGAGTRYAAGYVRGASGFGGVAGLADEALKGAGVAEQTFAKTFVKSFGKEGLTLKSGTLISGTEEAATKFLRSTGGKSFFREIGLKATAKLATEGAGKMVAARALAFAVPGLNIVATAAMAYDIGAMVGEGVKSAINLAKDAQKSMKGSISKPLFGMGYRDTEAAATSRARGVMAIQNSQLNARSALGSEAGLMAAHFG